MYRGRGRIVMVHTYKIVLCGAKGVGKSSIFFRIRNRTFDSNIIAQKCTQVQECFVPLTENNTNIKINLWDTLGLEEHAKLTRSHYVKSQAVLVVYSADIEDSLEQARDFLSDAKVHAPEAAMVLVRNKIDLDIQGSVQHKEFHLGNDYRHHAKISAKTGEGVDEMLHTIYEKFLQHATPTKPRKRTASQGSASSPTETSNSASKVAFSDDVFELQISESEQSQPRRSKCHCSSM